MENNCIKLVVMDMDGTLLSERGVITPATKEALLAARHKGVQLAICSGRNCLNISELMCEAGLCDCHVLSLNGSYCLERTFGPVMADHRLGEKSLKRIIPLLDESGLIYAAFQGERVLDPGEAPENGDRLWAYPAVHGREALEKALPVGVNKLVVIEPTRYERLARLKERLAGVPGLCVTSSWVNNLELMPEGCSKGTAVRELAERLKLPISQVMALGDQDNDIEMLRAAGLSVAMGNASEGAKQAAKTTTDTNARDGVAKAIRRYVLEESL